MFEMISDMWSDGPLGIVCLFLLACCALLLLGLVALGADFAFGHNEHRQVIVMEKTYSPASSNTGIVTGVTSSGKVGTGIATSYKSEEFVLIVKDESGEVFSHEVEPSVYVSSNKGDRIDITVRIGRFSNSRL